MKLRMIGSWQKITSRAPHGARGLKSNRLEQTKENRKSRPARGAWIEILPKIKISLLGLVAPRTGRVD